MKSATVVLVHGAFHGAWCWDRVVPLLHAAGVRTVAVDLPGHGASPSGFADLHGDAAAVTSALDAAPGPVVLVGHSYGGAVITEAGAYRGVDQLVYLCAFNLDETESCAAAAPDVAVAVTDVALRFAEDGATVTLDPAAAVDAFYADCAPADIAWAISRLGAQPFLNLQQSPATIAWRERPSTYVVCTEDRAVHPELQRVLAARATRTVEWPTSHSPFLSRPELVAELLTGIAREVGSP